MRMNTTAGGRNIALIEAGESVPSTSAPRRRAGESQRTSGGRHAKRATPYPGLGYEM